MEDALKDALKFYEKLNRSRKGVDMCRENRENLLMSEREGFERWQQHYDEHLNVDVASTEYGVITDPGERAQDERFPALKFQEIDEEIAG